MSNELFKNFLSHIIFQYIKKKCQSFEKLAMSFWSFQMATSDPYINLKTRNNEA